MFSALQTFLKDSSQQTIRNEGAKKKNKKMKALEKQESHPNYSQRDGVHLQEMQEGVSRHRAASSMANKKLGNWGHSSVVGHLPIMWKGLGLHPQL